MKQKPHVIKKNNSIPPLASKVYLDELVSFSPFILEITTGNPLMPFTVSFFILDEVAEVSSSDGLAFEPFLSFLWKVESFSNGLY